MLYHLSYIPSLLLFFYFPYFIALLFFFAKMHPVGFEPTHLSIAVLETAPLDHSGTNAYLYYYFLRDHDPCPFIFFCKMHPVGFEPTHLSIAELKSAPLDHSGTNASCYI